MSPGGSEGRGPGAGAPLRCAALAQILVFSLGIFSSAAGLHGCPRHHHSRPPRGGASGQAASTPDAAGHLQPSTGDRRPGSATCNCLGACQSGTAVAIRAAPPALAVEPGGNAKRPSPGNARSFPAARPDYFLPYPLGPPAS